MRRAIPVLLVGSLVIGYYAGRATSPTAGASAQAADTRPPKWQRIPLAPDQGAVLHWSSDQLLKAHTALVASPRAAISDLLPLPITRTHMFSFRHTSAGSSGPPSGEQHEGVTELHFIVSGSATATMGGQIENRQGAPNQPGEYRGGPITGGTTFHVKAGDVVNIPPNAPHAYQAEGPDGITYMLVKINVGLYPWSLVAGATLP
jgi:mannose-6-phosphate isomerase-like protein (cupin superfamily)